MKVNLFIPSAGKGTRLLPLTEKMPKALVEVNGTHMIDNVLHKLISPNIDKIIVNVHHCASELINYLHIHYPQIIISDETDKLLGTGGGLKKVIDTLNDDKFILVQNVDIDTNFDVNNIINQVPIFKDAMAYMIVSKRKSTKYLLFDESMKLCGWRNTYDNTIIHVKHSQPACFELAYSGLQIVNPKIEQLLSYMNTDVFDLIPAYLKIASTSPVYGYNVSGCYFNDIGKIDNLKKISNKTQL